MEERIGVGFYQSCWNRQSVGHVSIFGLQWCRWGVGKRLWPGSGGVVLCQCRTVSMDYLCRWQVQVSVYCARGYLRILGAPSV